jgi:hypothetical protein
VSDEEPESDEDEDGDGDGDLEGRDVEEEEDEPQPWTATLVPRVARRLEKERMRSGVGVRCGRGRVGRRMAMEPPWLTRVEVPHISFGLGWLGLGLGLVWVGFGGGGVVELDGRKGVTVEDE